ncbi:MAG TPA: hypothetical protein VLA04_02060 [Verrucomicrobiae bacterium]|nr:hypothetical protein [Verrucomicrobiae bacterium]
MNLFGSNSIVEQLIAERFRSSAQSLSQEEVAENIARIIEQKIPKEGALIVSLIGGAASGKSSLSASLLGQIRDKGIAADAICVDDYNKYDRAFRRHEYEGEHPARDEAILQKFDIKMLNGIVEAIRGNVDELMKVAVPEYDEKTGVAVDRGPVRSIGPVKVLLVCGDFNLVERSDLVVYLHMNDEDRLANRIRRDALQRAEPDTEKTKESFLLRQEIQHFSLTLPTTQKADYLVVVDASKKAWTFDLYSVEPQRK